METLRGSAILLLLAVLGLGGYFAYQYWERHALRIEAGQIIDQASALYQQVRRESGGAAETELASAFGSLERARSLYSEVRYREARERARESRDILLSLLDASKNRRESGEARFIAVQGRVEYRRGDRGEWEPAEGRGLLRTGDYVKTSDNGSAEIMFDDGTLYTVRPNTLFLVSRGTGSSAGEQTIELQYGWLNLNTARRPSKIATPQAQAQVADDSEAVVSYDEGRHAASFTTYRGAMDVAGAGGETRRVEALQTVSQEGALLSAVKPLPPPPDLVSPDENADVDFDGERQLRLAWEPVPGAASYALQISRNRLFVDNVIDVANRRTPHATLGLQGEGTFLWRVAAVNEDELTGPWSEGRRFRVASRKGAGGAGADHEPPQLEIEGVQSYGSIFIVRGQTEAGASVWVNGESVAVEANGSFTKTTQLAQQGWDFIEVRAADAWGNEATRRQRVFVENL